MVDPKLLASVRKARDAASEISPEFNALTSDLDHVLSTVKDPVTIGVLLFSLAQERKTTNDVLSRIEAKLDILTKQGNGLSTAGNTSMPVHLLPESDQKILFVVNQTGGCTASEIQQELGYKGSNAASQRLNALVRAGRIQKIQSGKKVYFTAAQFGLVEKKSE